MRFRPCIDLRNGRVVQIVGGTLADDRDADVIVNYESPGSPADFAAMYQRDNLHGGHVIALGPGNTEAVIEAVSAFPGGLHAGGGITPANAGMFLDAGASHVIVTSYVFTGGRIDMERLRELVKVVGRERLVLDLSCRKRDNGFYIVTDRWQKFTDVRLDPATLEELAGFCDEFLVHGVDVEGRMRGIQEELVEILGRHSPLPATYAGGAGSLDDLDRVNDIANGRVDLTIGSALDIFGGALAYRDVVDWHRRQQRTSA